MRIIESYDNETQRILEGICTHLKKILILECMKTGEIIGDDDSVYYEKEGLVSEEARNATDSLYLGPLFELRDWCREKGHESITEDYILEHDIESISGPVGLSLSSSDEEYLEVYEIEEAAPPEEDE